MQVYYVVGLAPEASRFFYFMMMLFLVHTMGISMFRAIAGLARDESIAITGGSFFFLVSRALRCARHRPMSCSCQAWLIAPVVQVLLMLGGFLLAQGRLSPSLNSLEYACDLLLSQRSSCRRQHPWVVDLVLLGYASAMPSLLCCPGHSSPTYLSDWHYAMPMPC